MKQCDPSVPEYISKFEDLAEHPYSVKPSERGSHTLASYFLNDYIISLLQQNLNHILAIS